MTTLPLWLRYASVVFILSLLYVIPNLFTGSFHQELHILTYIKIPILLTAILVGFGISVASAALQVSLNNPLADPGIIGISSGASLMAAFFLVFVSSTGLLPTAWIYANSLYFLPLLCFAGAMLSGLLIYTLARKIGTSVASFILAGIAVSTAFSAIVGWLYLVAPAQSLQSLTFWLMGSLQYTTFASIGVAGSIIIVVGVLLIYKAQQLNKLYLGDSAAEIAGLDAKRLQTHVFLMVALLIGVSVSIAGSIAFLGLLVPHAIRRLHGYDNRVVFLLSGILGSAVILLCALINEYIFNTAVPLSMLTASVGAPLFIYVLFKR